MKLPRVFSASRFLPRLGSTVLILGIIIMAYVLALQDYYAIQEEMDTANLLKARAAAGHMETYLRTLETVVTALSQTDDIKSTDHERVKAALLQMLPQLKDFASLGLYDQDGNVIYVQSSNLYTGPVINFADREWFAEALKEKGGTVVSDTVLGKYSGKPQVIVAVAVKSPANETIAVFAGRIKFEDLGQKLQGVNIGKEDVIYLLDSKGIDPFKPERSFNAAFRLYWVEQPLFQAMMAGKTGVAEFVDPGDGIKKIGAFTPVVKGRWGVIVAQPKSKLYMATVRTLTGHFVYLLVLLPIFLLGLRIKRMREARLQEEQLRKLDYMEQQAEKMLIIGELAASVAHEIRNPITAIKGFLQVIMDKQKDPKGKEFLQIVLTEINRIEDIIEDFLGLARPSREMNTVCNIKQVLYVVTALAQSRGLMNNVAVLADLNNPVPLVNGNCQQLKQVFLNLATNAIQAMPNGGTLTIALWYDNTTNMVNIRFTDTGTGIPPEVIPRLGERFFTTKDKGTGLGLNVSYKIVESCGGSIHVESRIGEGTTFIVRLPVARVE